MSLEVAGSAEERALPKAFSQCFSAALAALALGLSVRTFFFFPAYVASDSMSPTIREGDRILIDRFTYGFRKPSRGDIVIFDPPGFGDGLATGLIYVKRLVGLGGERITIGDDWRVRVNGVPITLNEPGFRQLYSFEANPAKPGFHHGHANQSQLDALGVQLELTAGFQDASDEFLVPQGELMVLGDNTLVSLDSRSWGTLPRAKILGRAVAVGAKSPWHWTSLLDR